MFNARKLAAIDLIFLGPKVIITEFSAGVFLSAVLGIFVLVRGHHSHAQIVFGLYLISLGINYVPMLNYAIRISRAKSARAELGNELDDKRTYNGKVSPSVTVAAATDDRPPHGPRSKSEAPIQQFHGRLRRANADGQEQRSETDGRGDRHRGIAQDLILPNNCLPVRRYSSYSNTDSRQ